MTGWKPDVSASSDPIYLAIAKAIASDVAGGRLKPGDRLPTHRELADELGLSIGTITRGYLEAVRRGLIRGETGRGTYVRSPGADEPPLTPNLGARADFINLNLNYPMHCVDPDLAPALRLLADRPDVSTLLRYDSPYSQPRHLRAGVDWMGRLGLAVEPEAVVITAGAHHALSVILLAIVKPGDLILTDELTYPGMITIAQLLGLRLQGIPMDDEGMDPDALLAACRQRKARAIYCMPTLHNPTLGVLTAERRRRIAEIAREYDLFIIEDDVHRPLLPEAPPPLAGLAPEQTFFIASISKVICGGLRIAYVVAPSFAREPLKRAVWATMVKVPSLTLEVATMWIADGTAERTTQRRRQEAEARQEIAGEMLGGYSFRGHPRAYNIWLDLPARWTGAEFAIEARHRGVAVTPASAFRVGEHAPANAIRICLGGAEDQAQLRTALCVIAGMLGDEGPCTAALV